MKVTLPVANTVPALGAAEVLPVPPVHAPQPESSSAGESQEQGGTEPQTERRKIEKDVQTMNRAAEALNSALKFTVTNSNRIIIKVIDTNSGEILREIPPQRLVEALEHMQSAMGLLMDRKV